MISRRSALKLGTAGLLAPSIGPGMYREAAAATATMQTPVAIQEATASWPMLGGNPARTNVMPGPGPRFDAPLVKKWEWSTIPAGGWTRPVVHGGMMYYFTGDMTGLLALDFATGAERWRALSEQTISSQIASGDTLFVSAYNILYALDAASGQERWRSTLVEDIMGHTMAEVDGSLYCRTAMGGVVAINAADGGQRWFFEERVDDRSLLAIEDGTLYFPSTNGTLFALDTATGTERWRAPITPPEYTDQSNVMVAEDTVFVRDYQGSIHAFDPASGEERWSTPIGTLQVLSAVHDGRLFGHDWQTGAYALDAASGQVLWNVTTELTMSVSGVVGDTVLAQGTAGAYDMWRVYGLDAATGEERWSFESYPRMYDPTAIGDRLMLHGLVGYVLANPSLARLIEDVTLRGAPAPTGIERGTATAGTEISTVGERAESGGEVWVRVTIGDMSGWIPLAAIDPATLAPEGEVEYVYEP